MKAYFLLDVLMMSGLHYCFGFFIVKMLLYFSSGHLSNVFVICAVCGFKPLFSRRTFYRVATSPVFIFLVYVCLMIIFKPSEVMVFQ